MAKVKTRYVCQNCGYISPRMLGRCPNCGAWNQLVEELEPQKVIAPVTPNSAGETKQPVKLSEITFNEEKRVHTGLTELDRVLGGGVVPGSLVLIGGDPGIGKSTLLLQVSGQLEQTGGQVLYVTGEESASQIKLRANRLHVQGKELFIYPETDMNAVSQMVQQQKPDYLIIDSVQTMNIPDLSSAIGSVAQVRAVTSQLMTIAKQQGVTVFVVGHVTKGGAIAGPKILEHMVDTVLYFEGDLHHNYRILRSVKNRFGSTNEIGMFAMQDDGLKEVANPSEIFLEERLAHATGSAVVVSMEGTRPILVEIQSLITPTLYGMAKRTTTGLDHNRVAVIMAVLEKRANILLQNQDAYLKATGGVHLDEPAIDLAMAMAIVSSYRNLGLAADECFVGEIGLTGEIRRVNLIDQRIKEAAKLGFQRIYVPANNEVTHKNQHQIEIIGVRTINDAIKKVFKNQR
ncbi:DNA repair protein RadA [Bombilactobacillus mellis]|uniref:DNA repair protein RadA n=1 Tax=Bombilactobacillus mellis TaxID=1218508 RepID=UPI001580A2CC|nr:DNA repair protein RadA [Lactobacillus sp. W8086]MBI0108187.1 DNA repair protein RadA [Lactobacillus sp. W8085]MBI0111405.1 DNA repair protein RadA [Lactobacillus sp. W8088]MBI0115120.1 DNA repair protein RadA [Lactobacillus sp. W8087]MBI0118845.1 DNA repair protein RadA [Lactobacillus sp. W8089]MBI0130810.1 DNA repair protein RadA [Lactobacillus sp. W8090]NUF25542.1 DNA repair protein RadA [Bombilactobacillus mellis]